MSELPNTPSSRPKAGIPTDADVQRASELAREIPKQSASRRDPWTTAKGFRVLPCGNAYRAWVEVTCPDSSMEMSAADARKLAAHLNSVATIVESWS